MEKVKCNQCERPAKYGSRRDATRFSCDDWEHYLLTFGAAAIRFDKSLGQKEGTNMKKAKWILGSEDLYVKGFESDRISSAGRVTYTFDSRLAKRFDTEEAAIEFRNSHRGVKAFGPRPENLA